MKNSKNINHLSNPLALAQAYTLTTALYLGLECSKWVNALGKSSKANSSTIG